DWSSDVCSSDLFHAPHLARLAEAGLSVPAVDQVESNPYFVNDEVRDYCAEHGISVEAWSPLAQGRVFGDAQLQSLAEQVGRSVSQVVIRWTTSGATSSFPSPPALIACAGTWTLWS